MATVDIRLSDGEKLAWQMKAQEAEMSLSAFVRWVMSLVTGVPDPRIPRIDEEVFATMEKSLRKPGRLFPVDVSGPIKEPPAGPLLVIDDRSAMEQFRDGVVGKAVEKLDQHMADVGVPVVRAPLGEPKPMACAECGKPAIGGIRWSRNRKRQDRFCDTHGEKP